MGKRIENLGRDVRIRGLLFEIIDVEYYWDKRVIDLADVSDHCSLVLLALAPVR